MLDTGATLIIITALFFFGVQNVSLSQTCWGLEMHSSMMISLPQNGVGSLKDNETMMSRARVRVALRLLFQRFTAQ